MKFDSKNRVLKKTFLLVFLVFVFSANICFCVMVDNKGLGIKTNKDYYEPSENIFITVQSKPRSIFNLTIFNQDDRKLYEKLALSDFTGHYFIFLKGFPKKGRYLIVLKNRKNEVRKEFFVGSPEEEPVIATDNTTQVNTTSEESEKGKTEENKTEQTEKEQETTTFDAKKFLDRLGFDKIMDFVIDKINLIVPRKVGNKFYLRKVDNIEIFREGRKVVIKDKTNKKFVNINVIPPRKIPVDTAALLNQVINENDTEIIDVYRDSRMVSILLEVLDNQTEQQIKFIERLLDEEEKNFWQKPEMYLVDMCLAKKKNITINERLIEQGIQHIINDQHEDGSWGSGDSALRSTILNTLALLGCDAGEDNIKEALDFLVTVQIEDGSWDGKTDNLKFMNTAYAALALEGGLEKGIINDTGSLQKATIWIMQKMTENNFFYRSFGAGIMMHLNYDEELMNKIMLSLQTKTIGKTYDIHPTYISCLLWSFGLYSKQDQIKESTIKTAGFLPMNKMVEFNLTPTAYGRYVIIIDGKTIEFENRPYFFGDYK